MKSLARSALQALVAALVALAVPLGLALVFVFGPPSVNSDGSPDNAPVRSTALFLFVSPVFLLLLACYFSLAPGVIRRLRPISLRVLLACNLLPSLGLGLLMAIQGFRAFGARDAAISFALFGVFSLVFLSLGSLAWWLVRPRGAL
jgi:hypothetical protein